MTDVLDRAEVDDLMQQEAVIRSGLRTFVDVGAALMRIRDRRLYRADHDTFEDYCRAAWGIDRRNANRTIEAATMAAALGSMDPTIAPASVRQARELKGLPPETAAEVMRDAHEATDGKPTAKAISEARERIAPKPVAPPRAESRPEPPDEVPAEPDPGVTEWLNGSQAVQDSRYVRAFTADLAKDGRVLLYDVERVASLLDEGQASCVYELANELSGFANALRRHRSSLRLVKGGK